MYPLSARDGAIDYSQNNRVAIIVNHRSDKQQLAPELDDKARRREPWKTSESSHCACAPVIRSSIWTHNTCITDYYKFFTVFFMFLTCFSLTINFFLILNFFLL